MKRILAVLFAFVLFSSHDMYLKLDTYFLQPNSQATIQLYNGTFDLSENVIDRNRMIDVSIVGNGIRTRVDSTNWTERDNMTLLSFATGEAGTKVAGVSTKPRNLEMKADAFNKYLEHDGVVDMLERRKKEGTLKDDTNEKYSKHVKTIFQVGDLRTNDWQTVLDYPIEFIPLANPYDLKRGDDLKVKLLLNGNPLANQLVLADFAATKDDHGHDHANNDSHDHASGDDHQHDHADEKGHDHNDGHGHDHAKNDDHSHDKEHGHEHAAGDNHDHTAEHSHDHEETKTAPEHTHTTGTQLRTDANGILNLKLAKEGIASLRTIHMDLTDEGNLTHESNWATLTFEVGSANSHGHDHDHAHAAGAHTHDDGTSHVHEHDEEAGFPSYLFYGGSLVLLVGLFFWFNRKN